MSGLGFDDCIDSENAALELWADALLKLLNGNPKGTGVRGGGKLELVENGIVALVAVLDAALAISNTRGDEITAYQLAQLDAALAEEVAGCSERSYQ